VEEGKSFIKGAVLLAAAALFVKILSAIYRVPFQNIVGDTGFYIFQQVYPFYGISAGLAVSGFPVVLSRLVAEADEVSKQQLIRTAFFTISLIGILSFLFLFFSASWMALAMGDEQLKRLIQLSAFFFLAMPYIAVHRGDFQGVGDMMPTAASQMAEQSIRVLCILLFSFYIVFSGRTLYEAGLGAVAGSLLGMIASILTLSLYRTGKKVSVPFEFDFQVAKAIVTKGSAICLSALTLVLLQLADSFQLYSGLVLSGIRTDVAKEWKGVYDRGQPMLQLGVIAAVSIALTVVPLLAKAVKEKEAHAASLYSRTALRISFALGLAASSGLAAVMVPLNKMLFETTDGSGVLAVFGTSIFFYSIIATMNAIFQGRGQDWIPAAGAVIALAFKWTANAIFIPVYGLYGASFATAGALLAGVLFLAAALRKNEKRPLFTGIFIFKTMVSSFLMMVIVYAYIYFLLPEGSSRFVSGVTAVSGALLGACLFFAFMVKWKGLNEDELRMLPFGSKIIDWTAKRNMRM
jgi:PST family polysaccharide transporter